jgi:hypothetical protein
MKICRECGRNFPDEYGFCLDDGSPLSEPLAGEPTEILRGPLPKTERISADAPAPTVASPVEPSSSDTLEAYKPKVYPEDDEPIRKVPTAVWVAASVLTTVAVTGAIYLLLLRPTNVGSTQTVAANTSGQTPSTTVATPDTFPSAGGSVQPTPEPAASSIVVAGKTQADTREYPIESRNDRANITRWNVTEGQLYDPCKTPQLATETHIELVLYVGGSREEQFGEEIRFDGPAIVEKIYIASGETYDRGRRLMTLGKIDDIFVYATLAPGDIERVAKRSKAVFTTPSSKGRFSGIVDMVDKASSTVRIDLNNSEIFDKNGCLNVYPDRAGELTIDLSSKL